TSASAPPANTSGRAAAATTSSAGTSAAAPSRTRGAARSRHRRAIGSAVARSSRRLSGFAGAAGDVEEHLFEIAAAVTGDQAGRRVVILDAAALKHDDAIAQAFDLAHVVRSQQN